MYSEEQIDQNPEVKEIQEEKSQKTNVKSMKKETAEQLSADEKATISALLTGAKPTAKTVRKKKAKDQLDQAEKETIVDLLHGTATASEKTEGVKAEVIEDTAKSVVKTDVETKKEGGETTEVVAEKVEKPAAKKNQISKKLKQEIILLLHDGDAKAVQETHHEVEIDYELLNKQELVEILEELVEEKDVSRIKQKIGKIKSTFHHLNKEEIENAKEAFVEAGGKIEEFKHTEDPLEQRFNAAFGKYRFNKARNAEDLEKQKQENLQVKYSILEELKELINSEETLKKTYDEFKHLQDRWKEVGLVPATELNNLWQNYHFLVEMFFDKVRINKELRDLDLKKNLEKKIEICEKAEELIVENSLIKSFKLLQKYHDEWREIGPVPMDQKDEIWDRFKTATDKINERRKEYYKDIQDEQERNYEAKLALCEKVEEIETSADDSLNVWQKKTEQVNELFKVWKTIGRAPKAKNDEIWKRFRGGMDAFFNSKREFLGKLKEQQTENLNIKIDLCVKAEAVKDSTDWRKTTKELIELQKEWKKIGPVPRRHSEKVWKRFRNACDEFFNNKAEFYKNIHGVEKENQLAKEALVKEISEFKLTKDKTTNLDALKSFQRRWMEIGHVPFKEKEKIQREYRASVDQLIDKMDINKSDLSKAGYEERIEIMKTDPDAERILTRERIGLQNKIKAISDEISLWENNISFFASSKKSEQLKKEFEKKIEKAKKEVVDLKSRLRMID